MKVLFVSSGNSKNGISPIIKNQGDSLARYTNTEIDYFTIVGKGIKGYLSNIKPLRRYYKEGKYDIVHAHYSLSAFVASIAGCKPLVVSLMGSDVKSHGWYRWMIKAFAFCFYWNEILVKSDDMKNSLKIQKARVIPNGVDFERFCSIDKTSCREQLGWDMTKVHLLFTSNPERMGKNYDLTLKAVKYLNDNNIELHYMKGVKNEETPLWYNASKIVLLTSLWEGSPNAIKEAMACNCPIVATKVGDIPWLFGEEEGYYLCDFDVKDCADKIRQAIQFSEEKGWTQGRRRIMNLGLDSKTVAKKIIQIYQNIQY